MRKSVKIGVVVVATMCATLLGGACLKQKEIINQKVQHIEELKISYEMETDKVVELNSKVRELTAEVDSARRDIGELEADIERDTAEIRELEVAKERTRSSVGREITVKVTGYCPCEYCCGVWATLNPGITASGTVAKYGTIAAPTSLPFGTQMYIEGYGDQVFTVEDTGSAVVYNDGVYVIDMWMPTHEQAYAVGNSIVKATIIN